MNILSLNTWGGKLEAEITAFILEQQKSVDVFCFQEVYPKMRTLCAELLTEYEEYYGYKFVTEPDTFHQAIYVRKTLSVSTSGVLFADVPQTGLGVFVSIAHEGKTLMIVNYHGMSRPVEKLDTQERIQASKELISFLSSKEVGVVIGDFNLLDTTTSVAHFEDNGFSNLIKKYGVENTRNHYAWDRYPDSKQYHSSFVFLTPGLLEAKFSVLSDEVADHQALFLKL